jgi:hypothetical protein
MDCLNAGEKKNTNYQNFDVENLQADQPPRAGASQLQHNSSSGGSRRRCCSIPALLGIAALLFSIVALILGIYATVAAKRLGGTSDNGMFLTTDPQSVPTGWKAVNLFKVSAACSNVLLLSKPLSLLCTSRLVEHGCLSLDTVSGDTPWTGQPHMCVLHALLHRADCIHLNLHVLLHAGHWLLCPTSKHAVPTE